MAAMPFVYSSHLFFPVNLFRIESKIIKKFVGKIEKVIFYIVPDDGDQISR
jgi:hypothetical protein